MKTLFIALFCCLPLYANAVSKCEINGKIVYQNASCPSDAVEKPIDGGTFSVTDTSQAAKQARFNTARMQRERLQREQENRNIINYKAMQERQEHQQAYQQQLINRANAVPDTNASIGEMYRQKIDRENAQRALGIRTPEDDQNAKIKRLESKQRMMESERQQEKYKIRY